MTRRDHCVNCGEMVGDYDVMCSCCSDSLCHSCITPYDHVSELCAEFARLRVICNPDFTVENMKKFINNFNLTKDNFFITDKYNKNKKYYDPKFINTNKTFKNLLKKYAKSTNTELVSSDDIYKLKLIDHDEEIFNFVCDDCYEKIKLKN
jgi:hypothetical protein